MLSDLPLVVMLQHFPYFLYLSYNVNNVVYFNLVSDRVVDYQCRAMTNVYTEQ